MEVKSVEGAVQVRRGAEKVLLTDGAPLLANDVILVGDNSSVYLQDSSGKVLLLKQSSQASIGPALDISAIEPLNLPAEESILLAQTTEASHSNFFGLESLAGAGSGLGGGSLVAASGATAAGAFLVGSVSEQSDEELQINSASFNQETQLTEDEQFQKENPDTSPNSPIALSDVVGAVARGADTAPEGVPPFDNIGDIVSTFLYGRDEGDIEGVGGLLVGLGDGFEQSFGDVPVLQDVTGTLASLVRNESPEDSPIADTFAFSLRDQGGLGQSSSISSDSDSSTDFGLNTILQRFDNLQ